MRKILAFLLLTADFFTANYKSGPHGNVQAAFLSEADRAYQAIIEYDENAPVTKEEIRKLYFFDFLLSPGKAIISGIDRSVMENRAYSPSEYAGLCLYHGKIIAPPPEGVRFVRGYLLPFSKREKRAYDEMMKSGETEAFYHLVSPLYEQMLSFSGSYTPENGFEPLFPMMKDGIVPIAEGISFLKADAVSAAMEIQNYSGITKPFIGASGIYALEYVPFTWQDRPSEAFFQGS